MRGAILTLSALLIVGCASTEPKQASETAGAKSSPTAETPKSSGTELKELKKDDVVVGKGAEAAPGDYAIVRYRGTFADGKVFDESKPDDNPFSFTIGGGQVIKGWDQGVVGMKVGGTRKLSVPWNLAYGEDGKDPIPPRTDLFFEVELLALVKQGEETTILREIRKPGSGPTIGPGKVVTMNYVGKLANGKVFDEDVKPGNDPLVFTVGKEEIAETFENALLGLKKGSEAVITCPPKTMYGQPEIPAGQVLRFEVVIKDVK